MVPGFYSETPRYENMQRAIRWLVEEYRDLRAFPIGKSVLGREITALCIGDPTGSTLFVGATHGLEWLTSLLLMRFCEDLLEALKAGGCVSEIDVRKALRSRSLTIVPCLNPDGVEIALEGSASAGDLAESVQEICAGRDPSKIWQANARGVDLNHNFDAGWNLLREMEIESGIDAPAPTRYGGLYPGSEPETEAIMTFCMTCQPRTLYAFHSQGEEIYYRYGSHTPARSRMIVQILASSSGYRAARPAGLASHGGLKDWFIDKYHRPGFTIEVGTGKNPIGLDQFDKIYKKIEEMLIIATLL